MLMGYTFMTRAATGEWVIWLEVIDVDAQCAKWDLAWWRSIYSKGADEITSDSFYWISKLSIGRLKKPPQRRRKKLGRH